MNSRHGRHSISRRRVRNQSSRLLAGFVVLTLALGNCIAGQVKQDATDLEKGKPIVRELKAGEIHAYQVRLRVNEFLRVVVDQRNIDLAVSLFGPDGNKIAEAKTSFVTNVQESVSAIGDAAGSYRLEVRPPDKGAHAGRYEIKIEEMRPATEQDSVRVAAERGLAEAEQLRSQATQEGFRKAIKKYEELLPLARSTNDPRVEALTLFSIGEAHNSLGERPKALEYYNQALAIRRSAGERPREALTLTNIGAVHHLLGDWQKALEYFNQALPILRSVGNRPGEASTLNYVGLVYHALADWPKALEYYNQALAIQRAVRDRPLEAATLNNIGGVYGRQGDMKKALEYYEQALAIRKSVSDKPGEGITLANIGSTYGMMGERQKALEYYGQALAMRRSVGDRPGQASTLNSIGEVYYLLGEMEKAHDHYAQSLQLTRAVLDLRMEAKNLYGIACIKLKQGDVFQARSNVESALRIVEALRVNVTSPELRASYFASVQDFYDFYIDLLMRMHALEPHKGYDALAMQASEKARARSLLEMLAEARADIRQGVDLALLERERSLHQLLDAKAERQTRLLSGKHTEQQAAEVKAEIDRLLNQYQEVQSQVRVSSPRYAALTQPQPLSLKQIQQEVLDKDTLLLEYSLGAEHSYLWAVTPNSIAGYRLPKRDEVEKAARGVYEMLTTRNRREQGVSSAQSQARIKQAEEEYNRAATALSQMILGPVAAQLGKKRLIVVADGILNYVPFAALPSPAARNSQRLLIVEHEIVSLPSASSLAVLRKELAGRKPAAKTAAVLADPVFDAADARVQPAGQRSSNEEAASKNTVEETSEGSLIRSASQVGLTDRGDLPRLPFSRQEADAIHALTRQAGIDRAEIKLALGFEASRATAGSPELGEYRIVHFATHGLLNNEHPELSGIVLSLVDNQGKPQNGFFRLYDVYNMNLGAELVVLSACQTALGKQVRGEGLIGLTRGFMYAGSARVMASLWRVEDEATAEMMKKFYEGVIKEGKKPAAALKSAQEWMQRQKRWRAPYYWAGFILQGEWR